MPTEVYAPINTLKQLIAGVWIVVTEVVFFHATTRTLLLTDLIENFETRKLASYLARLLTRLGGVQDPDGQMSRDLRLTFRRQEKMIAWNPERDILAHGAKVDRMAHANWTGISLASCLRGVAAKVESFGPARFPPAPCWAHDNRWSEQAATGHLTAPPMAAALIASVPVAIACNLFRSLHQCHYRSASNSCQRLAKSSSLNMK
jgi:hypothetical protein